MRLKNLLFRNYVIGAICVSLLIITLVFILRKDHLPPEVPLFYGLAEGQDQLAPSTFLIIPILVSNIFLIINIIAGFFIKDGFLKKSLVVAGIAFVALSWITTLRIVFLIGTF